MAGRKQNISKEDIAKRIRVIQEWLLLDHTTADIISNGVVKWEVTERQMYRYLKTATVEFKKMNDDTLDHKRAYHIQRRKKMMRDLDPAFKKTPNGIRVMLHIQRDIARLEGLYVEKHIHEIGGIGGKPIEHKVTPDLSKLTDDELRALIELQSKIGIGKTPHA